MNSYLLKQHARLKDIFLDYGDSVLTDHFTSLFTQIRSAQHKTGC